MGCVNVNSFGRHFKTAPKNSLKATAPKRQHPDRPTQYNLPRILWDSSSFLIGCRQHPRRRSRIPPGLDNSGSFLGIAKYVPGYIPQSQEALLSQIPTKTEALGPNLGRKTKHVCPTLLHNSSASKRRACPETIWSSFVQNFQVS